MDPVELEKLKKRCDFLESEIEENENRNDREQGFLNCSALLEILPILENEEKIIYYEAKKKFFDSPSKQTGNDEEYLETEKEIRHLSSIVEKNRTRKQWIQGIKNCDNILRLLSRIQQISDFPMWWNKRLEFVSKLIDPKAIEEWNITLDQYQDLLTKANLVESTDKMQSRLFLSQCLALILFDEAAFVEKYPQRSFDLGIIQKRLQDL